MTNSHRSENIQQQTRYWSKGKPRKINFVRQPVATIFLPSAKEVAGR